MKYLKFFNYLNRAFRRCSLIKDPQIRGEGGLSDSLLISECLGCDRVGVGSGQG